MWVLSTAMTLPIMAPDSRSSLVSWLNILWYVSSPNLCLNWVKRPWLGVLLRYPHALATLWSFLSRSASLLSLIMFRRCLASWALNMLRGARAVAHEMARIMYFILVRNESYRGENRGLTERKLKSMGKRALDGLRN